MASLITNDERVSFTSSINDHFDTFKRSITIFIEPKQNFNNASPQKYLPGYQASSTANPALTIQSAAHDAIVTYGDFNRNVSPGVGKNVDSGLIKIKIKQHGIFIYQKNHRKIVKQDLIEQDFLEH